MTSFLQRQDSPRNAGDLTDLFYACINGMPADVAVFVKYTGRMCIPCQQFAPVLDEILGGMKDTARLLTVSVDDITAKGIDNETRRAFFRAVKGDSPFPHLQIFRAGILLGSMPVYQIIPEVAREHGLTVDDGSGHIDGDFPYAAMKERTLAFIGKALLPDASP